MRRGTCSSGVVGWNQQINLPCSSHWPHLCRDDYGDGDYDDEDEDEDDEDDDDEDDEDVKDEAEDVDDDDKESQ